MLGPLDHSLFQLPDDDTRVLFLLFFEGWVPEDQLVALVARIHDVDLKVK